MQFPKASVVRLRSKIRTCDVREVTTCRNKNCNNYVKISRKFTCSNKCLTELVENIVYLVEGAVEDVEESVDDGVIEFLCRASTEARKYLERKRGAQTSGRNARKSW